MHLSTIIPEGEATLPLSATIRKRGSPFSCYPGHPRGPSLCYALLSRPSDDTLAAWLLLGVPFLDVVEFEAWSNAGRKTELYGIQRYPVAEAVLRKVHSVPITCLIQTSARCYGHKNISRRTRLPCRQRLISVLTKCNFPSIYVYTMSTLVATLHISDRNDAQHAESNRRPR